MRTPINLSGGQVSGVDDLSAAASSIVNWEADAAGVLRPRPALTAYAVTGLTTAQIIGMERWASYTVLCDYNRQLQYIADYGPGSAHNASSGAGTILEGMSRPTWVVARDYIYAAGGGRVQRWNPTIAFSETLGSSPNCTHIASIGQYLISNDLTAPDRYRWSDIGEGAWTSFPAANFSSMTARPDNVVGVFENARRLYVFGTRTAQIHEVGADPTLPFDMVASVESGLGAPYAFAKSMQEVVYLDHRRRVVMGDPTAAQPISGAIDRDLRSLNTISDCFIYREDIDRQANIVVRFPAEARTFVYDLNGQKWRERAGYSTPFRVDYPTRAYVYRPLDNGHLVASTSTTGTLYKLDAGTRQDAGSTPLVCEYTTGWQNFGTNNRKASRGLTAMFRRGTAAVGAVPGALELRVQNDDTAWSPWVQISVGGPDDYSLMQRVFDFNAILRARRYGLRFSTTEDMSLVSLDDDITDLGGL